MCRNDTNVPAVNIKEARECKYLAKVKNPRSVNQPKIIQSEQNSSQYLKTQWKKSGDN